MNNAKLDAAEEESSRGDAETRRVRDLDEITGAIIPFKSQV